MNFLTVNDCAKKYPCIPVGGLRHLIHKNTGNFRDKVTRKVGNRVLISELDYLKYLDEHKNIK